MPKQNIDTSTISDREIVRALFRATRPVEGEETQNLSWIPLRIDPKALLDELLRLSEHRRRQHTGGAGEPHQAHEFAS